MKVDVVMWTKNGAKTLPQVLKQISHVIPKDSVNQKIIIDDHSADATRSIARRQGWVVAYNECKGISDAANQALAKVETDYFCSFEQDLLLSKDWWVNISKQIQKPKVAVVSGMRFLPAWHPVSALERHTFETLPYQIGVGRTLDNTMYNTEIIRNLGGFPKLKLAGIDTVLSWVVEANGYQWIVDNSIHSLHLRCGLSLIDGLKRQGMYAKAWKEVYQVSKQLTSKDFPEQATTNMLASRLIRSPIVGAYLAVKQKNPLLPIYYPFFQVFNFTGFVRGNELLC